jgi:hypothetical protein
MQLNRSEFLLPSQDRGVLTARYQDVSSGCSFVVATPAQQPRLWLDYLDGALRSYRKHGVECVLEYDQVVDGTGTALFFAALDDRGAVVGGMRVQGAYVDADQAHAIAEWGGREGTDELRSTIASMIPDGVIEMKTGWVDDDVIHRSELTDALARIFVHSLRLMDVRHAIGTVAQHAVPRWRSTGGVVCDGVAAVPYPSEKYRTVLMHWDAGTFADLASPRQLPHLMGETAQLTGRQAPVARVAASA